MKKCNKCKGTNCTATDRNNQHSAECIKQHDKTCGVPEIHNMVDEMHKRFGYVLSLYNNGELIHQALGVCQHQSRSIVYIFQFKLNDCGHRIVNVYDVDYETEIIVIPKNLFLVMNEVTGKDITEEFLAFADSLMP